MTDGRDGGVVFEERVREVGALGQQPVEPRRVLTAESREVVVPELIDRDEQHQADRRPLRLRLRRGRGTGHGWRQQNEDDEKQQTDGVAHA